MIDDASDTSRAALPASPATHDDAAPHNDAPATSAISDAGVASDASPAAVAALANDLAYTVTVGQARELFARHGRKVPAERTLQNYCVEPRSPPRKFAQPTARSG